VPAGQLAGHSEKPGIVVSKLIGDIVIILVIILIGGFFAGAEMALVSLREGQIRKLSRRGKRGQRAAKLAQDPNRFLSAVQIGVTLATLFTGAYGAATLANMLSSALVREHISHDIASPLAFALVTVAITYVTLILGELAPKRIALQRQERVALVAAPILDRIAILARPLVWLLSKSTNLVVTIVGGNPKANRTVMTEEELRDLVASNQALSQDEREIVADVFDAGKRQLREVLLPRTEVEFVSADTPLSEAARLAASVPYSRLPVYRDSYDNVIGFVHIRDLLDPARSGRPLTVGQVARHIKFLPISKTVLTALSEMRRERAHLAIVLDEYGGTAGIVTLEDLVEELIGDIRDEYDVAESEPRQLRGGEVEVDGLLNLHEFAEQTGIDLPEGPYETAAGFVLAGLGEVPAVGQSVEVAEHRITVTEMDGRRIARLRIAPAGGNPEPPDGSPPHAAGQLASPTPASSAPASSAPASSAPASSAPASSAPASPAPASPAPASPAPASPAPAGPASSAASASAGSASAEPARADPSPAPALPAPPPDPVAPAASAPRPDPVAPATSAPPNGSPPNGQASVDQPPDGQGSVDQPPDGQGSMDQPPDGPGADVQAEQNGQYRSSAGKRGKMP
jgi:putative hemolysin